MGRVRVNQLRLLAAVVSVVVLATACQPPGSVEESFGGPTGIQLPCSSVSSARVTATVGGATVVACAYPVEGTAPTAYATRLFAFLPSGEPDESFGTDGVVELPGTGTNVDNLGLARTGDGAIWVSRLVGFGHTLSRVLADGSLDPGFGVGGSVGIGSGLRSALIVPVGDRVQVVIQEGLTGCSGFCPPVEGLVVRTYLSTGQVLPAVTVPLNHLADPVPDGATNVRVVLDVTAASIDAQYRLTIAGVMFTWYTAGGANSIVGRDLGAVRLSGGSVDASYGASGVTRLDIAVDTDGSPAIGLGQEQGPMATAVHGGDVVFAIGAWWLPGGVLGRLGDDGALDATFGNAGMVAYDPGNESVTSMAVDQDRRPILGVSDGLSAAVTRFTADGSLDTEFGDDGRADLPQAAGQMLNPRVYTPLARIFVLVGHTQQGANGIDLLRVNN